MPERKRELKNWQLFVRSSFLFGLLLLLGCQKAPTPTIVPIPINPFSTELPGPTITPTRIVVTPTFIPTPTATLTPEISRGTFFEQILAPLIADTAKRRQERALNDPEYRRRIDWQLNVGRINILLFGYGDSHEPPVYKIRIASPTIVSINTKTKKIDFGSFTHDLYDPLLARILGIEGQLKSAQRIDQSILNIAINSDPEKKFKVPQASIEYMTGLSVDYQIQFSSEAMGEYIDEVLGGMTVNLPVPMPYGGYWYQGQLYNEKGITRDPGSNRFTGGEAVGFIEAVSLYGPEDAKYNPMQEHNYRKWLLISALLEYLKTNADRSDLQINTAMFFSKEMLRGTIATDFNIFSLLFNNLSQVASIKKAPLGIYPFGASFYGVDTCCVYDDPYQKVNQPIQWLTPLPQPGKEVLLDQIKRGVFRTDIAYQVPRGGDPTGDLVAYWLSTRLLVRHHFQH